MRPNLTPTRATTLLSALLALPFATLLTLLILHIEPPLGPLRPYVTVGPDQPNVVGTAIVLGAFGLCLAAFYLSAAPLLRAARAGVSLWRDPVALLVAAGILAVILLFVGAIVVDQYPCWVGVPNCD